jgi:hypothetical protein
MKIIKAQKVEVEVIPDSTESKQSYRKRQAAVRAREVEALAEKFKRQGARDPITQARDKLAPKWGFASGGSLNRWLRRNR